MTKLDAVIFFAALESSQTRMEPAKYFVPKERWPMALPIKDTPVLKGKDAQKFVAKMASAHRRKVPKTDYDRAQRVYRKMAKSFPALA